MIIERAELEVQPGKVQEFIDAIETHRPSILAGGCKGLSIGSGIESPSKVLMLAEWESVDTHLTFQSSPAGAEFFASVGGLLAGEPSIEHFSLS
jgi:quinol monooxygenase YgiN